MGKIIIYSKRIHIVAICCFLLPFFNVGCEKPKEENTLVESVVPVVSDSILVKEETTFVTVHDTTVKQTLEADTTQNNKKESEFVSKKLSDRHKFLQHILVSGSRFSGIAIVIDGLSYISFFSVFLSFLFLVLSFLLKFIEPLAKKTIALMNILAFITLSISTPMDFFWTRLWGCWVSILIVGVLMLLDLYILKLTWKKTVM